MGFRHLKCECGASLNARERTREKKVDRGESLLPKHSLACEHSRISGCRLSPPKITSAKPSRVKDFCDVGILSQSQFSSSSPRTTARGIRCEEHSSFILSWNVIGQGETKVITSQKSFLGSGSQTLFSAETSDSRKYVCVRRLSTLQIDRLPQVKYTCVDLWEG